MSKYGREYTNVECGDLALGLEWDVCMASWKNIYIYIYIVGIFSV